MSRIKSGSFCVDNVTDAESIAKSVEALRRTIQCGKIAERALHELETEGACNRRVPIIHRLGGKNGYMVRVTKFPRRDMVTRSNISGWSGMSLDFGPVETAKYGSTMVKVLPVFIKVEGAQVLVTDMQGTVTGVVTKSWSAKTHQAKLGECRLKSNKQITFMPTPSILGRHVKNEVFRVRKGATDEELRLFAKTVAHVVVQIHNFVADEKEIPQKLLLLRQSIQDWLIEDGTAKQFFSDLVDGISVSRVMED